MMGAFDGPSPLDIYEGIIGHPENDANNFTDLGDGSESALINVTLFAGRDRSRPLDSSTAQGTRIRCRIAGPIWCVLQPGTRVMVAIGHTTFHIPGAGIVIGAVGAPPGGAQFAKDRVVMDFGPKTHVVIRGASVSLQDAPTVDGPRCYLSVGAPYTGGPRAVRAGTDGGAGFAITGAVFGAFSTDGASTPAANAHLLAAMISPHALMKTDDDPMLALLTTGTGGNVPGPIAVIATVNPAAIFAGLPM